MIINNRSKVLSMFLLYEKMKSAGELARQKATQEAQYMFPIKKGSTPEQAVAVRKRREDHIKQEMEKFKQRQRNAPKLKKGNWTR